MKLPSNLAEQAENQTASQTLLAQHYCFVPFSYSLKTTSTATWPQELVAVNERHLLANVGKHPQGKESAVIWPSDTHART